MEKSFIFNSVNGDRKYKAENFREYFASFIGNGVFPNPSTNLQVMANDDMTVTIKQGKGWINGAIYINTDDYIVSVDPADGVLSRIDRVVLRMDTVERKIYGYIKKGDFTTNAVAKNLQRDADAYEIALADIKLNKGAISITQADITDLRINKDLCGIVHGTVEQVDTTTLFNQYQAWFAKKMQQYNSDLDNFIGSKKQAFTAWYDTTTSTSQEDIATMKQNFENEFNTWFNSIKNILSEDISGNLLNLINANTTDLENFKTNTDNKLKEVTSQMIDLTSQGDIKRVIITNIIPTVETAQENTLYFVYE
ncbi:hypothetical protein [Clostridium ganghwense]|uniref:Phage tail protein n=1 Tax=Clostridium ganghwense TaxID=312089 RepID=A0ABT4CTS1_9CLOT|nr:hypothetical protein [Clostridium ganghwense]MCY6372471.1 hypothetical protein [Clostridium ganghwense]